MERKSGGSRRGAVCAARKYLCHWLRRRCRGFPPFRLQAYSCKLQKRTSGKFPPEARVLLPTSCSHSIPWRALSPSRTNLSGGRRRTGTRPVRLDCT